MKPESIKILTDELQYKLGRIEFFKSRLEEMENKDKEYDQSTRRLAKLIDEAVNLIQIMKIEELDEFSQYENTLKTLQNS
ncbi:hypothetical protein [Candidatus Nitrosopumilus sediminis]|uniref:Uncharacterized protein n=1 Tax=Candidatus Nitrosopumilus sediminis TaxID=1229909 RepID=K0B7N4_9ARCH|nr:hypothetical protein [Candidatus Nitrosopumilus sediminis]AFS82163.1 hypothetical protein NSED_01755 [Candidatus Nitrosopumilus sediminis]